MKEIEKLNDMLNKTNGSMQNELNLREQEIAKLNKRIAEDSRRRLPRY
jgi:hypothetical protein